MFFSSEKGTTTNQINTNEVAICVIFGSYPGVSFSHVFIFHFQICTICSFISPTASKDLWLANRRCHQNGYLRHGLEPGWCFGLSSSLSLLFKRHRNATVLENASTLVKLEPTHTEFKVRVRIKHHSEKKTNKATVETWSSCIHPGQESNHVIL